MFQPRTVKTLTALFAAMTLGTLLLTLMEDKPIQPVSTRLAAIAMVDETQLPVIAQAEVPLREWKSIVIHTSVEGPSVKNCHFFVDDPAAGAGNIRPSDFWKQQGLSRHVPGRDFSWNTDTIGICLTGDFAKNRPSAEHLASLVKLVTDLQAKFKIPASHVYLYSDIAGKPASPGAAFPQKEFHASLLQIE